MSPQVILDDIPDSSDIPRRFINATETRNRVDASMMMQTVKLLTDAAEAHRRMRFHVNMNFVDAGTAWTIAVSKLLSSLDEMMQGHVDDSFALLSTLDDVYSTHVDYVVTTFSTLLQDCDVLTAEVHIIAVDAQLGETWPGGAEQAKLLVERLNKLNYMLWKFDSVLEAEVSKSSYGRHYFPMPMNAEGCRLTFRELRDGDVYDQMSLLDDIIYSNGTILADDDDLTKMIDFREQLANLSWCLLSYKQELDVFRKALVDSRSSAQSTDFDYEIPSSSLLKFDADDQLLASMSSQYIASSLSKFELAKALDANGSEVLSNADRLYADIDTSLFSEASDLINSWEKFMSSFYMDLVQQVNIIQGYMLPDDTEPEQFLRRLSVWRMPIVNFQKSQVSLLLGRPSVKRFVVCYRTTVLSCLHCLSVTLVYCGQTARWLKMPLGTEVGLGPGDIVLDGNPAPPPLKGHSPQFSAHVRWPNSWID